MIFTKFPTRMLLVQPKASQMHFTSMPQYVWFNNRTELQDTTF